MSDSLPTVQDLIDKLNEFDKSLPIMAWNWSDFANCILPVDVEGIHLFGDSEDDKICHGIPDDFDGQSIVMDTMW